MLMPMYAFMHMWVHMDLSMHMNMLMHLHHKAGSIVDPKRGPL